ncbi:LexA family transcriptional repressor [Serratia fonticola]|nr:LexA family transcriptional repressor [Serratia fonticola]
MKMLMQKPNERLRQIRESKNLSQSQLARLCGWSSVSRIGNYELGTRKISAEDAAVISAALEISPGELLFGEESSAVYKNYKYMLLTSLKAGSPISSPGSGTDLKPIRWITSDKRASEASFWLEVKGHSMTAPQGASPSFPAGMLILVDPLEDLASGDYCIAEVNNSDEAVFRQYLKDAGTEYLVALNSSFHMIEFIERGVKLVGKVIAAKWGDDKF